MDAVESFHDPQADIPSVQAVVGDEVRPGQYAGQQVRQREAHRQRQEGVIEDLRREDLKNYPLQGTGETIPLFGDGPSKSSGSAAPG